MLSGNSGTWNPSGARWLPVSWFLFSQLFHRAVDCKCVENWWAPEGFRKCWTMQWTMDTCSMHPAACTRVLMYYIYVFFITQTLALNAFSTTGTQICTVQQGIGVWNIKTKQNKKILHSWMCHLNFVIHDTRIQEQLVAITTGVGSGKKTSFWNCKLLCKIFECINI